MIGYSEESDIAAPNYPPDYVQHKIKFTLAETSVQYVFNFITPFLSCTFHPFRAFFFLSPEFLSV